MPGAFSKIFLVSLILISGCANTNISPSLNDRVSYKIVQVPSDLNTNPGLLREYPYFIVCNGSDCPVVTTKTPIRNVPFKSNESTTGAGTSRESLTIPASNKGLALLDKNKTTAATPGGSSTTLLEMFRVHFDYASALISSAYQELLESFVKDFNHGFSKIRITGYTDNGSKSIGHIGNEWLALERAANVKKNLIALGYPESQILLEAKFLCCYIDSNENEEGRRNNRRAEISLLNLKSNGDSL